MQSLELTKAIKEGPIIVDKGRYAYLKGKETEIKDHFLISKDKDETTIITEEANLKNTKYGEDVKWFKLLQFKVSVPFLIKGFLAKISKTIADADLNILIVSTFSKDYVLIREEDYPTAKKALTDIGFRIYEDTN